MWRLHCSVVGFLCASVLSIRNLSLGGVIKFVDTVDNNGFVTRQSTVLIPTYHTSKFKHRFQLDEFGVAYVGRQAAGVDFKHHSVLILDGGATLHCVAQ